MRHFIFGFFFGLTVAIGHAAPAHVHGEARLEIAIEADGMLIRFETPLDGLLGFEHSPRTNAQKQAVQTMQLVLESPERLFQLPAQAQCKALPPEIESPVFSGKKASGHLDLDASYHWRCANPSALNTLNTLLFAEFPRLKCIKLELVGPRGQKSGLLSAQQPRFSW